MQCFPTGRLSLSGKPNDSVPVGRRDAVVLSDHHGEEVLGSVGSGHRVQTCVSLFPVTGQEVVNALLKLRYVFVGQFGPLALWW